MSRWVNGHLVTSRWPQADWDSQRNRLVYDAWRAYDAGLNGRGAKPRSTVCHWCWFPLPEGTAADGEHMEARVTGGRWVHSPANIVLSCPPCNRGALGKFTLTEAAWMDRLEPLAATLRGCPRASGPRRAAWVRFRLEPRRRRYSSGYVAPADAVAAHWATAGKPLPELKRLTMRQADDAAAARNAAMDAELAGLEGDELAEHERVMALVEEFYAERDAEREAAGHPDEPWSDEQGPGDGWALERVLMAEGYPDERVEALLKGRSIDRDKAA